jgi:hypothetical protein
MLRILTLILALWMVGTAHAQPGPMTSKPVRMSDGTLLQLGASEAQVLAKFKRPPDREVKLESKFGAAVGQRGLRRAGLLRPRGDAGSGERPRLADARQCDPARAIRSVTAPASSAAPNARSPVWSPQRCAAGPT